MAITKVSESTFVVNAGTGANAISLPGTPLENDIVIVAVACSTVLFPSGSEGITGAGYNLLEDAASSVPGAQAAYKRMGASPDATVEITSDASRKIAGLIQIWRGVDTTTAIDASATRATGASGDPDPPSYTTVTNNALRVVIGFLDDDDATVSAAPSGYGDLLSGNTGQSSTSVGATVTIASLIDASASAENPGAFTTSGDDEWIAIHFALRPSAAAATAAITGTAGDGATEAQIVAGGETIIITLTGDTWVTAGGTFDAIRQDIIDGLDSAQSEGTGWNAEVRDNEVVSAVVRTSDTVVTITLTAAASYNITAPETITATVPDSAVTGTGPYAATPTFVVSETATGHPAVKRMGGVKFAHNLGRGTW